MDEIKTKRINSIDFIKGILIIGVTYGHVVSALLAGDSNIPWLYSFVRSYDMPCFAFISGLLLAKSIEKNGFLQNILNKITQIVIPAFIWELLIYGIFERQRPIRFGQIWYLYSIGICLLILIVTEKLFRKNKYILYMCFLCEIMAFHLFIHDRINIGFLLFPACVGFIIARETNNQAMGINIFKLEKKVLIPIVGITILMEVFWKPAYNVWHVSCNWLETGNVGYNIVVSIYRGSLGVLCSIVVMNLVTRIHSIFEMKNIAGKLNRAMSTWGKETQGLYILQCYLVSYTGVNIVSKIIRYLGYNPFLKVGGYFSLGYIFGPIITMCAVFVMYLLISVIKRIPFIGTRAFGFRIEIPRNL